MVTADFVYVQLLGDRKGIGGITKRWEKVIVDRKPEMRSWVDYLRPIQHHGVTIFVYMNKHYAGFAPTTVELFERMWKGRGWVIRKFKGRSLAGRSGAGGPLGCDVRVDGVCSDLGDGEGILSTSWGALDEPRLNAPVVIRVCPLNEVPRFEV